MAFGFGNTGAVTFGGFASLTGSNARQVGGPGWSAASGDVTPINRADNLLRSKVVSGRQNPEPLTVEFFMNPALDNTPTATPSGALTITYPTGTSPFLMNAGMTRFKWGDLIDDDVMVGECEFLLLGEGLALDDTTA